MAVLSGVQLLPKNNIWNTDISGMPVHANSATYIMNLGGPHAALNLNTQFPLTIVGSGQAPVTIHLVLYASDSDPGPSPIPHNAGVEANSDHHVLVLDTGSQKLYELFNGQRQSDNSWNADVQAIFDMTSNDLRTSGHASGEAAGQAMLPGILRYAEAASGTIDHALRVVVNSSHRPHLHIWPARHDDGPTNPAYPPYGLRLRLKASVDISSFSTINQTILRALKQYGLMIADVGPEAFAISADTDARWTSDINELGRIHVSDFEALDVSSLMVDPNSGATSLP